MANAVTHGWTERETETLVLMWGDGCTTREIGDALKKSKSAIGGKLWRMGLGVHNRTKGLHFPARSTRGVYQPRPQSEPSRPRKFSWETA